MKNIKILSKDKLSVIENINNFKYYVYAYLVDNKIVYIGQGSDANRGYKRALDINSHNEDCQSIFDVMSVKIIGHYDTPDRVTASEAAHIKFFNTVNDGFNRREELTDPKFYDLLEALSGNDYTVESLISVALENAYGVEGSEPYSLAEKIANYIDHSENVLFVGNEGFGGFSLIETLYDKIDRIEVVGPKILGLNLVQGNYMNDRKLTANFGDFLEKDFGDEKYDLIIMNPPWVKIGTDFIDKAINLLNENGRLVCIISNNQFTAIPNKKGNKPGSFIDLQERGSFYRIETFKGNTKRDYFGGKGDWVWFIWDKNKNNKTTQIANRLGDEFEYQLTGKEYFIPQLPNESDYFDYENSVKIKRYANGTLAKPNILKEKTILLDVTKNKAELKIQESGEKLFKQTVGLPYSEKNLSILNSIIDIDNLYDLYSSSHGGDMLRIPPIKKELAL